jgi:hypothetical protein
VVDDARRVAVVLRAVCVVDLVVEVVGLHEENVFADSAGANVSFVARLGAAVAVADDPDRHRFAQRYGTAPPVDN